MRPNRWTILWVVVVVLLATFWVAQLTGAIAPDVLIANPMLFLTALVVIAILAAIGAMFLGLFVGHRLLSGQAFSPFEQEMLKMREEVREIREKLHELLKKRP